MNNKNTEENVIAIEMITLKTRPSFDWYVFLMVHGILDLIKTSCVTDKSSIIFIVSKNSTARHIAEGTINQQIIAK